MLDWEKELHRLEQDSRTYSNSYGPSTGTQHQRPSTHTRKQKAKRRKAVMKAHRR